MIAWFELDGEFFCSECRPARSFPAGPVEPGDYTRCAVCGKSEFEPQVCTGLACDCDACFDQRAEQEKTERWESMKRALREAYPTRIPQEWTR